MNNETVTTNSILKSNIDEITLVTDYGLDALSAILHETAIEKGFWNGEINHDKIGNKLALVHSEITEVLEAIRKDKGSSEITTEIADVIIRLLDVYAAMRNSGQIIDSLDEKLFEKMQYNKSRKLLHGNLF